MSAPDTTGLPELPMPRTCPYQVPAGYAGLRADGPLTRARLRDGTPVWVVTGYEQARTLLADPRMSSDVLNPRHPELALPPGGTRPDTELRRASLTFVEMDDPQHARHRRMVLRYFTVRRVRELRPHIESCVDTLLTAMADAGPPADLMSALAVPLPALTLCEVLGVPEPDRPLFLEQMRWPTLGVDVIGDGFAVLHGRIERLLRDRRTAPEDDLLSGLARCVADGELTERQALDMCFMLIIAGHETTANTLSLAVLTLLAHPDQLALLRADPTSVAGAVDELLRYLAVADTICRVATGDIEIDGRTIAAGDGVVLLLAAANRDGRSFPEPDRLDVRRPARHLTFGHGVHQCLGHALARTELEIALTGLLTRLPTLRPAVPEAEIPVKPALSLQGVARLPVTW